jgi:hypothetical protein
MKPTRRQLTIIAIVAAVLAAGSVLGMTLGRGDGGSAKLSTVQSYDASAGGPQRLERPSGDSYSSDLTGKSDLPSTGAAAPSAPSTEPDATDPKLQNVLDRKIVQSSSVDLGVKEVGRSFQEIIRQAETAGGFVASSSFSNVDDQQIADLTIRVPNDQYQNVLAKIRGLGDVNTEASDANDVTEQYTDYQARLRTLQATEQRYLELLAQAANINDILTVQDRLDAVRGQIEQLQGQINLLEHTTDLATITIHLQPLGAAVTTPNGNANIHPLNAASNAWEHSLDALRGLAAAALVVAVFSWWLLPPLALMAFGARWWVSRRPRPNEAPA